MARTARLSHPVVAAWLVLGAAACVHTAPAERSDADTERQILKERVARLERRTADLETKLALYAKKLADRPSVAPAPWPALPDAAPGTSAVRGGLGLEAPASVEAQPAPTAAVELLPPHGRPETRGSAADAPSAQAAPDDAPVEIVLHGSRGVVNGVRVKPRGGQRKRARRPRVKASPIAEAAVSPETPMPRGARAIYAWSRGHLTAGRCPQARTGFAALLKAHRRHDLADNAHYWTGFCLLEEGDKRGAIAAWHKLLTAFPKSPKAPDAYFGMGQAHEALGEPVVAEAMYAQIVAHYPGAERHADARAAVERLKQ